MYVIKKAILVFLATFFLNATANAGNLEDIEYVYYTKPGSSLWQSTEMFQAITGGEGKVNFAKGNIAGALEYLNKTKKPTIIAIDPAAIAAVRSTDNPVWNFDVNRKNFVSIVFESYSKICASEKSGLGWDDFKKGGHKLGAYYGKSYMSVASGIANDISKNTKVVPFKKLSEAIGPLHAGELDFVFSSIHNKDGVVCLATANPDGGEGLVTLGDEWNNPLSTMSYRPIMIGVNINIKQVRKAVAEQGTSWFEPFAKKGRVMNLAGTDMSPRKQIKNVNAYIDGLTEALKAQ